MNSEFSRRPYRSPIRQENVQRTRSRIATTARDLFLDAGYGPTSMTAIAKAAGVSAQTVYNTFGSKAALLKYVYDITLVGDEEPVPFAGRPEVQALYQVTDPREFLAGYVGLGAALQQRLAPLLAAIHAGAAAGDPDLVAHLAVVSREHRTGVQMAVGRLAELGALRCPPEDAVDAVWLLTRFEVWNLLRGQRGWPAERCVEWLAALAAGAVLPPAESGLD